MFPAIGSPESLCLTVQQDRRSPTRRRRRAGVARIDVRHLRPIRHETIASVRPTVWSRAVLCKRCDRVGTVASRLFTCGFVSPRATSHRSLLLGRQSPVWRDIPARGMSAESGAPVHGSAAIVSSYLRCVVPARHCVPPHSERSVLAAPHASRAFRRSSEHRLASAHR